MLHVHIGLSPLAQALILPVAKSAGLESVIVGRTDEPAPPLNDKGGQSYELKWEGANPSSESRSIHSYLQPGSFNDLPADLRQRIGTERSMLLTASIRDAIVARQSFVTELLKARPEGSETLVMPCENKVPDAWREIEQEIGRRDVVFIESVVNRIAVRVEEEDAEPGTRATRTHPVGEWVVKDPQRESELLDAIGHCKEVEVVGRLEPYKFRKLFLVNGGHLAVAIRGAYLGIDSLRETARAWETLVEVTGLHAAMIMGMTRRGNQFPPDPLEYAKEQISAYCEVADDVSRIMKPLKRANLVPFLSVVEERLTQPALLTAEAEDVLTGGPGEHEWLKPYVHVFRRLEAVLERLTSYSDIDPDAPWTFLEEPDRDEAALNTYEKCLAWIPDGDVRDRRVVELAKILGNQRARYAAKGTPRQGFRKDKQASGTRRRDVSDRGWPDVLKPRPTGSRSAATSAYTGPEMRSGGDRRQRNIVYSGADQRSGKDRREGDARAA